LRSTRLTASCPLRGTPGYILSPLPGLFLTKHQTIMHPLIADG